MDARLQRLINDKNRETDGARRRQFGRKATDQQHHANLFAHVEVLMDALRKDIAGGMPVSTNLREAMREIGPALTLSKKRLQP